MTSTAFRGFGARTAEIRASATKSVWGNKKKKGGIKVKPDGYERRCRECKDRWAKKGGICEDCRAKGLVDNAEAQARRARERHLAEERSGAVRRVEVPKQMRTIVVDGREFEVVWDGKV